MSAVDSGAGTRFGFKWGPMDVRRLAWIEGRGRVLAIDTDHVEIEVRVSDGGRRIHVYAQKGDVRFVERES